MTPLEQLKNLLVALGDNPTPEDTSKALEMALLLLVKINKENEEAINAVKQLAEETKKMEGEPGEKGEKGDMGEQGIPGKDGGDGKNGADGKNGVDGKNGIDGTNGIDGKNGVDGTPGKDGSPDTPVQVRDKLETLQDNDRLDISAIKGMEKYDKDISILKEGRPIFGPGKTKVLIKDLSASLDGATKTFTIGTNFGVIGVFGSSSPFPFRPIVDYAEVGKTIVFSAGIDATVSLAAGQTIIVQFLR